MEDPIIESLKNIEICLIQVTPVLFDEEKKVEKKPRKGKQGASAAAATTESDGEKLDLSREDEESID